MDLKAVGAKSNLGVPEEGTVGHFLDEFRRRLRPNIQQRQVARWTARDQLHGFTLTVRWKDEHDGQ